MQAIALKLQPVSTTMDVEKINSYEELLANTNRKLHYVTQCSERLQRVRYQCKMGMENLKRTIDAYYTLLGKTDDCTLQIPENLAVLMQEQRNELNALTILKESLCQKLAGAMVEYLNEIGADLIDEK